MIKEVIFRVVTYATACHLKELNLGHKDSLKKRPNPFAITVANSGFSFLHCKPPIRCSMLKLTFFWRSYKQSYHCWETWLRWWWIETEIRTNIWSQVSHQRQLLITLDAVYNHLWQFLAEICVISYYIRYKRNVLWKALWPALEEQNPIATQTSLLSRGNIKSENFRRKNK